MDRGDCDALQHYVAATQSAGQRRQLFSAAAASPVPAFEPADILILSGGTTRSFSALSLQHQREFAKRMGYRFAAPVPSASIRPRGNWRPYWHKVFAALGALTAARAPKVVVWADDDGVFVRQSDMIERFVRAFPGKSVIIAQDADEHAHVNSGMMILRNDGAHHAVSVAFLEAALARGKLTREIVQEAALAPKVVSRKQWLAGCSQDYDCLHEQQAISELLRGQEELCRPDAWTWNQRRCTQRPIRTSVKWLNHVAVVPQRDGETGLNMNTYSRDCGADFCANDFWVQATGLTSDQRLRHVKSLIARSTPPAQRLDRTRSAAGGKRIPIMHVRKKGRRAAQITTGRIHTSVPR